MTGQAQELVERVLAASRTEECVVLVTEDRAANLRWAGNTLTTNGVMRSHDVTVVAISGSGDDAAAGVVTRTGVTLDQVEDLVRLAEAAARDAGPAEDAAPLSGPTQASTDWSDGPVETDAAVFSELAPALGDVFRSGAADGIELFGFAEHMLTTSYLGTSTGARLRHVQPTGRYELTAKSEGRTRSTWVGRPTRDFTDVDVHALDAHVRERLGWQSRRVDVDPGRYATVLPPNAMGDLLVYLYWTASGRDAFEGRTVFSRPGGTRVGETLTPRALRLFSDPAYPGLECEPFVATTTSSSLGSVFDNAMPVEPTSWIHDGRLAALINTRHTATLTGMPVAQAADNLVLEERGASGSLDDLVRGTDRGLLVTSLWYIREVDPQTLLLTGLTRDGVYLVEGGEVTGVTSNFRFNESPVDMLGRLDAVGSTEPTLPREWADFFTRAAMPAVRVDGFNMSTTSPGT